MCGKSLKMCPHYIVGGFFLSESKFRLETQKLIMVEISTIKMKKAALISSIITA
jgi:hypothetical protein